MSSTQRFEYNVLNLSEVKIQNDEAKKSGVSRPITLLDVMNQHGSNGWEIMFKLTDQSFLMKRALTSLERPYP